MTRNKIHTAYKVSSNAVLRIAQVDESRRLLGRIEDILEGLHTNGMLENREFLKGVKLLRQEIQKADSNAFNARYEADLDLLQMISGLPNE